MYLLPFALRQSRHKLCLVNTLKLTLSTQLVSSCHSFVSQHCKTAPEIWHTPSLFFCHFVIASPSVTQPCHGQVPILWQACYRKPAKTSLSVRLENFCQKIFSSASQRQVHPLKGYSSSSDKHQAHGITTCWGHPFRNPHTSFKSFAVKNIPSEACPTPVFSACFYIYTISNHIHSARRSLRHWHRVRSQ